MEKPKVPIMPVVKPADIDLKDIFLPPMDLTALDDRRVSFFDRRIEPRLRKVLKGGQIVFPADTAVECIVHNLSERGANLEVHQLVPLTFELFIESEMARHDCRVVWRNRDRIGVVFEE